MTGPKGNSEFFSHETLNEVEEVKRRKNVKNEQIQAEWAKK